MVTAAEAEAILAEDKVIGVNLTWRGIGRGHRLEAKVLSVDSGAVLSLRGYVGVKNRSYALLYQNTPIRKYTVHDRHRNPATGEVVLGPHKHTWDDEWADKIVYVPDDIRVGDPNEELLDFLAECNIRLQGTYNQMLFFPANQGGTS